MKSPVKTILIVAVVVLHICLVKATDATSKTHHRQSVPYKALAKKVNPEPAKARP